MINQPFKPADMAREVLDALREINQIENRLTGILATLLAMDTSVEPVHDVDRIVTSFENEMARRTKGTTFTPLDDNSAIRHRIDDPYAKVDGNGIYNVRQRMMPDGSVDTTVTKAEAGVISTAMDVLTKTVTLDDLKAGGVNIKGKAKTAVMADVAIRRDAVMDLWATTNLTQNEIGKRLGLNPRNVRRAIQYAREAGDPRAIDAWRRPQVTSSVVSSQQPGGTLRKDASDSLAEGAGDSPGTFGGSEAENVEEAQADNPVGSASPTSARSPGDEDSHTSSPAASEPEIDIEAVKEIGEALKPDLTVSDALVHAVAEAMGEPDGLPSFDTIELDHPTFTEPVTVSVDLASEPDQHVEAVVTASAPPKLTLVKSDFEGDPSDVILFDRANLQIVGPTGVMTVDKPWLKVFRHMADARIYDIRTLAGKGGFSDLPRFYESLRSWKKKLETIGVELVFVGRELFKLRAIED